MIDEDPFEQAAITLDRDTFFRSLIRELVGALENVVGLKEASGFISLVGQRIADTSNREYCAAAGQVSLNEAQVANALVDFKRRIGGDFFVIEQDEDKIVLGNRHCPFGEKVLGRPSMCMMTSNVFGSITADNLGFAKVELRQTIAAGNPSCVVVVHLRPTEDSDAAEGREYVGVPIPKSDG